MNRKSDKPTEPLPVHSLETDLPVHVRAIEYNNPYDFTREHRHDYYEILFFATGGGMQLIDFLGFPVRPQSCYIVFPRQVHLLRRGPEAAGRLVQFREEVVPSTQVKNLLRQVSFGENPSIIYEEDAQTHAALAPLLDLLGNAAQQNSTHSRDVTLHYLQALLLQLVGNRGSFSQPVLPEERLLLFRFQELLEEQFMQHHSVQHYSALTATTEKKLAAAAKKFLGLSPLQVIHNRLLLEAKRILLFEQTSHKEIAFRLGFDSPASFSQFIKNKTGFTPSELSEQLVKIHE